MACREVHCLGCRRVRCCWTAGRMATWMTCWSYTTNSRSGPVVGHMPLHCAMLHSADPLHISMVFLSCAESQAYVLNFHGRVTQASVKNFQLVHESNRKCTAHTHTHTSTLHAKLTQPCLSPMQRTILCSSLAKSQRRSSPWTTASLSVRCRPLASLSAALTPNLPVNNERHVLFMCTYIRSTVLC